MAKAPRRVRAQRPALAAPRSKHEQAHKGDRRGRQSPHRSTHRPLVAFGPDQWQVMYKLACFDLETTRVAAGIELPDLCRRNGLDIDTMRKLEKRMVKL